MDLSEGGLEGSEDVYNPCRDRAKRILQALER